MPPAARSTARPTKTQKHRPHMARSDSAAAQVDALLNATKPPLDAPLFVNMREGDEPFLRAVVRSRSRESWTECDLITAGHLARVQHDIEDAQAAYDEARESKNRPEMTASLAALEAMSRREQRLLRSLRLGGTSVVRSEQDTRHVGLEEEARRTRATLLHDDALLMP